MSSPASSVKGTQAPRLRIRPDHVRTYGDLASGLATRYGVDPDEWQRLVLDDWLAVAPDEKWAGRTCCVSAPRQNGKNVIIELREVFGVIGRHENILHTAHQVRTAQAHFKRLKHFFGQKANDPHCAFPELNKLVDHVRSVNGQEGVFLKNGGSISISARSGPAGRGLTFDVLVCDEAQDLSDQELEAISPVISAAPLGNPQTIMVGTPPGPRSNGETFGRIRSESLAGNNNRISWIEWSPAGVVDLDDRQVWADCNPGLGYRLQIPSIEDERTRFSDDGFARERLGQWDAGSSSQVINQRSWALQVDQESTAVSDLALAVDIAPDRDMAAIAVAGKRADERWHVELEEHRAGIGWIAPYVANLVAQNEIRAVIIDGLSPAASIIDDLERRGITVTRTGARDMAAACGQFYDAIIEGQLYHIDQPQLNYSLSVARKRSLLSGEAWGWNRKSAESDITPLVAATLACWGAQSSTVKEPVTQALGQASMIVYG